MGTAVGDPWVQPWVTRGYSRGVTRGVETRMCMRGTTPVPYLWVSMPVVGTPVCRTHGPAHRCTRRPVLCLESGPTRLECELRNNLLGHHSGTPQSVVKNVI